uniref:Endo/exonuclease/phosphatase domain-containing protein n=1 Tax=Strongyloides venezuelensis TaxID=75913 RepID=A0A0K0FNE4_STRVS
MFGDMNRYYYNNIYNPGDKKRSPRNIHSTISNEYPNFMDQMLPQVNINKLAPFTNPFFGSGDYSNIMDNKIPLSNVTATMLSKIKRLPAVRAPLKSDGIDGYRIYSRSTMVEIAYQYDYKQWKEILGRNPHNDIGILLTLQIEKKSNVESCVVESVDSGYSNDFHDKSSYSNYLTQCSAYPRSYGPQRSIPVKDKSKFLEMKNIWASVYGTLLLKNVSNSESNIYAMFLDKLAKKISITSTQYDYRKKNISQRTIVNLSDIEIKEYTYTREEMLMISKNYTPDEWKDYFIKNYSSSNIIMNHLRKDIFIVDNNPMRPKMSKEVKAIFRKFKNKKKYGKKIKKK